MLESGTQGLYLENLKVGIGVANSSGSSQGNSQVVEAVVIISEMSELVPSSCIREQDMKTEILYFKDFVPSSIAQSSLDALTSINWKSYGLALRSVADHDGCVMLEWENLPPDFHIHIAIHCYHRQLKQWVVENSLPDRNLARKAVKCALDDLKENNQGVLLSTHALKTCDYAPDLAKTLAQLIFSSNDFNFQEECCSLLGVQSQEVNADNVGNCIREKIISVIGLNDRPKSIKKPQPSSLKMIISRKRISWTRNIKKVMKLTTLWICRKLEAVLDVQLLFSFLIMFMVYLTLELF